MNRGSRRERRSSLPVCCFNEAPIHESGKDAHRDRRGGLDRGFNEAPIHESGKESDGISPTNPVSRFNEAPIHESGKWFS